jgi:hypothetical protein
MYPQQPLKVDTGLDRAIDGVGNFFIGGAAFLFCLLVIPAIIFSPVLGVYFLGKHRWGKKAALVVAAFTTVLYAGWIALLGLLTHGCFGDDVCLSEKPASHWTPAFVIASLVVVAVYVVLACGIQRRPRSTRQGPRTDLDLWVK